jgi:hypothetical protein
VTHAEPYRQDLEAIAATADRLLLADTVDDRAREKVLDALLMELVTRHVGLRCERTTEQSL